MKEVFAGLFLILLLAPGLRAQRDTTFTQLRVIEGDIVDFSVDNLDNVYTLSSRNQLRKYNANGDSMGVYNDVKKFGQARLLDVSNPLKILLYYKDFSTIVVLDRFLNPVNTIDLRKHNIFQAKAIGQSYDNNVWVYDEVESKLKKVDAEGKLMQETPDLRLLIGRAINPVKIMDENKYVYLYDTLGGVYVFDYFGTFRHNIQILRWQNLKVTGKYIFGSMNDSLYRYEISSFGYDDWKIPGPLGKSRSFNFSSSRLYALKEEEPGRSSLHIYSIR